MYYKNGMVSIIVPVYNIEKYISECVNAIAVSSYKNLEIILVDDSSPDLCPEICDNLANEDNRIKVLHVERGGVSAARNKGLKVATGEFIVFVDGDDIVSPNMIKSLVEKIQNSYDIVFCRFLRFFTNGTTLKYRESTLDTLVNSPERIEDFIYSRQYTVKDGVLTTPDLHGAVWRCIYRTRIIRENKISFKEDLKFAEDRIFVLEYLEHVGRIGLVDDYLYQYRAQTKPWRYLDLKENHLALLRYQEEIISRNSYYSQKEKRNLIDYLRCTTYFMILNEEMMFHEDAYKLMPILVRQYSLGKLFTIRTFTQKFKVRKEPKRIILFLLIKLHLWKIVQMLYPNKKY